MVINVGLKVPNVLRPGEIVAVLLKLVLSKLLLLLVGFNGFKPCLVFTKQEHETVITRLHVLKTRGESGFSRLEFGLFRFQCRLSVRFFYAVNVPDVGSVIAAVKAEVSCVGVTTPTGDDGLMGARVRPP